MRPAAVITRPPRKSVGGCRTLFVAGSGGRGSAATESRGRGTPAVVVGGAAVVVGFFCALRAPGTAQAPIAHSSNEAVTSDSSVLSLGRAADVEPRHAQTQA
jgi:hypothetical protein